MAELMLKIGDRSPSPEDYKDGDILCAFSERAIRCVHAQHICHVRTAQRNASGLIVDVKSRAWFEYTHQYRFERVSATEIQRVEIATGTVERFSDKPNERGEVMDVRLFIARRKQQANHYLFGEDGSEVWYGGQIVTDNAALSKVWNVIQSTSSLKERDFMHWPAGKVEVKSHLLVRVDPLDDDTAEDLTSSQIEPGEAKIVQRRIHKIDWRESLGLKEIEIAKAMDRSQEFDLRPAKEFKRADAVTKKPLREKDHVALDLDKRR